MESTKTQQELLEELENLTGRLAEAEDTLHAIRTGQVDALLVENEKGHQLYTLRTADQTYRVFIEQMEVGAVTLNKDEFILYSNSQFASMVDLPLTRVIGTSFSEFIPDEYKNTFKILVKKGWESGSKEEIPLRTIDGRLIPILLSITPLELDEGAALSIILTNLSVQKQAEHDLRVTNEQLRRAQQKVSKLNSELEELVKERTKDLLISREHFKFLADNIPVIVWTTASNGIADYFNKRWYEYTGLNYEDSIKKVQELVHADDLDASINSWKNAVEKQQPYESEFRFKRATDGVYRWHHAHAIPFRDEAGKIVAWFGTSIDIDDQKRELEKKDEFIGVASHELKTPLTSLKGYVQLVESQENLSENVKLYIRKANESITKLQHLISDLLDVSKIQAGKLKFTMERLDLTKLLQSCIENSRQMYPSFVFEDGAQPGILVNGNAERLEQVVMNLFNNAVKYSGDRKNIIVKTELNKKSVTVLVTDFGIGLSAEEHDKVFERFYRVVEPQFMTPGLGMGLYISSEIIKEHGGEMGVKSKLNEGSTFSFTLPVIKDK